MALQWWGGEGRRAEQGSQQRGFGSCSAGAGLAAESTRHSTHHAHPPPAPIPPHAAPQSTPTTPPTRCGSTARHTARTPTAVSVSSGSTAAERSGGRGRGAVQEGREGRESEGEVEGTRERGGPVGGEGGSTRACPPPRDPQTPDPMGAKTKKTHAAQAPATRRWRRASTRRSTARRSSRRQTGGTYTAGRRRPTAAAGAGALPTAHSLRILPARAPNSPVTETQGGGLASADRLGAYDRTPPPQINKLACTALRRINPHQPHALSLMSSVARPRGLFR